MLHEQPFNVRNRASDNGIVARRVKVFAVT